MLKTLEVTDSYTKRLEQATQDELREYRLIGGGRGIHFPLIDEIDSFAQKHHLSRSALLQKATSAYIEGA